MKRLKIPRPVVALALVGVVAGAITIARSLGQSDPTARTVEAAEAMLLNPAPIDGERAYKYLKQICAIGPRTAGSEANKRQRKLVSDHFTKMGANVREQPFKAVHPKTGEQLAMANVIGSWFPERDRRIVIAAHYDTRPQPDQETDPERLKLPFIGANDGASGVALLMEIAHHLNAMNTRWGVDLVLFDGEELVYGNQMPQGQYFLGSEEFARRYAAHVRTKRSGMRYAGGILLDMVGGRDLRIQEEPNSFNAAPNLMREVWGVAHELKVNSFVYEEGQEVRDDHLALIQAGIPTIDLIDFKYPFWHKADDVPENCSAHSLAEVGRVVTAWLTLPRRTR